MIAKRYGLDVICSSLELFPIGSPIPQQSPPEKYWYCRKSTICQSSEATWAILGALKPDIGTETVA